MTKKKVAAFFTAAALCGALAVGSSMAYLTDHDLFTGVTVADEYEQDNLEVTVYEESVQTTDGQKEYTSYQDAWKRFGGGGQ